MNSGTKTLINVGLSVLAPVFILNHCSAEGAKFWQVGTTPALFIALSLPIGYCIYSLIESRKLDPLNVFGFIGTLLTAIISLYATNDTGSAIQPDSPWWYAAKEALIPIFMASAIILTARGKGSLLRVFIYTDSIFNVQRIEHKVTQLQQESAYQKVLWHASLLTAASLFLSAIANFIMALIFLLPVLNYSAAEQSLQYNYAVSSMTWWGYLIIGVPLLLTLMAVMHYLLRALGKLLKLGKQDLLIN